MIFVLRQIQEKGREQSMGLCAAFVDLTKAFDAVSRDGLRKILARFGCPLKFLSILRQLHEGQKGEMKHDGFQSDSFMISNGVKQGCILAPTLFSIIFSIMILEAKEDLPDGIYIRFPTDGNLFNLRRLLSRTKIPPRNSSLSCCLLTTPPFSPTRMKPYSASSTASLMQPKTSASPPA